MKMVFVVASCYCGTVVFRFGILESEVGFERDRYLNIPRDVLVLRVTCFLVVSLLLAWAGRVRTDRLPSLGDTEEKSICFW